MTACGRCWGAAVRALRQPARRQGLQGWLSAPLLVCSPPFIRPALYSYPKRSAPCCSRGQQRAAAQRRRAAALGRRLGRGLKGAGAGRQVGRVEQMETLNAMQKRSKGADTPKSGQAECPPPTLSAPASAGLTLPKGASAGDGGRNGRCASGSCARC